MEGTLIFMAVLLLRYAVVVLLRTHLEAHTLMCSGKEKNAIKVNEVSIKGHF